MDKTAGRQVGHGQGLGFILNTTLSDFAQGFPLDFRFGLAYTSLDPGNPLATRRTFINDGTNGTPQEYGKSWDLRVDLIRDFKLFEKNDTVLFAGPRYSSIPAVSGMREGASSST